MQQTIPKLFELEAATRMPGCLHTHHGAAEGRFGVVGGGTGIEGGKGRQPAQFWSVLLSLFWRQIPIAMGTSSRDGTNH